jgi:hypothetical protein
MRKRTDRGARIRKELFFILYWKLQKKTRNREAFRDFWMGDIESESDFDAGLMAIFSVRFSFFRDPSFLLGALPLQKLSGFFTSAEANVRRNRAAEASLLAALSPVFSLWCSDLDLISKGLSRKSPSSFFFGVLVYPLGQSFEVNG